MDDGYKNRNSFLLSTNSYTLSSVELLSSVLKNKFDIDSTIHQFNTNQYKISIRTKSVPHFKELVAPYFHDSMKYKLI
jgi:LAGLIDADG DNA endonuclease family